MDFIDYRDSRPIYEQIAERYKTLILKGVLAPDEKMPSVRSLAMELSTNPNTVQRAYTELERQGFLYSVRGKGNFVCRNDALLEEKRGQMREQILQILQEAEELGLNPKELLRDTGQAWEIYSKRGKEPDSYD